MAEPEPAPLPSPQPLGAEWDVPLIFARTAAFISTSMRRVAWAALKGSWWATCKSWWLCLLLHAVAIDALVDLYCRRRPVNACWYDCCRRVQFAVCASSFCYVYTLYKLSRTIGLCVCVGKMCVLSF